MSFKNIALGLIILIMAASCSSAKHSTLPYFDDLKQTQGVVENLNYTNEIKPDDELLISIISTVYPEATLHYNLPASNPATIENQSNRMVTSPAQQTYLVDSKGYIDMPEIGRLHVAGMTVEQLKDELTKKVTKKVSDAVVNVQLLNFQVVVAGEVTRPSNIKINRQRYSILDALTAAGDLTPYGRRDNVLIIREENGKRVFARVNLNSADLLTSPYFYLKQNDYIYVSPNSILQDNARYNQNNAFKLTVVSTVVSAASVLASLLIALLVK